MRNIAAVQIITHSAGRDLFGEKGIVYLLDYTQDGPNNTTNPRIHVIFPDGGSGWFREEHLLVVHVDPNQAKWQMPDLIWKMYTGDPINDKIAEELRKFWAITVDLMKRSYRSVYGVNRGYYDEHDDPPEHELRAWLLKANVDYLVLEREAEPDPEDYETVRLRLLIDRFTGYYPDWEELDDEVLLNIPPEAYDSIIFQLENTINLDIRHHDAEAFYERYESGDYKDDEPTWETNEIIRIIVNDRTLLIDAKAVMKRGGSMYVWVHEHLPRTHFFDEDFLWKNVSWVQVSQAVRDSTNVEG